MQGIRTFLRRIGEEGTMRPDAAKAVSMGRERVFDAYDLGDDTIVAERGIAARLDGRPSLLVAEKGRLRRGARGRVMTVTTGNHAVAAMPLLDGTFWGLSALPPARRSETLASAVVCGNVVNDKIELSQRDVPAPLVVACDAWLTGEMGFALDEVFVGERTEPLLDHYRRAGQEWRVAPLAWTEQEIRAALAASRKRIATSIVYFHSARGVHFLTYPEFRRFTGLAKTDPAAYADGLRELAGVYESGGVPLIRQPKFRGHHEVEFFGLRRGDALDSLAPAVEALAADADAIAAGGKDAVARAEEACALFASLLAQPELADESSVALAEALYMNITGEAYAVAGGGAGNAFDDRRTALPGATFCAGRPVMHPGADERTEVLLANLRGMMSKDEQIEYANVYELRSTGDGGWALGQGPTREVVYKSNRRPLAAALVEKRLSSGAHGYAAYVLSRIGALKAVGVSLSDGYMMLKRRPGSGRGKRDYYIRRRCDGEPLDAIPASFFRSAGGQSAEDEGAVLALASLMGDAAAQNMAMKKYDPATRSPLFGVGKEIYAFAYDLALERQMPRSVSTCSIRGSFGWPDSDCTNANLERMEEFYAGHYAIAFASFCESHPGVSPEAAAERFLEGFAFRMHEMAWRVAMRRDEFEAYNPPVPAKYAFRRKWLFAMWALERHDARMARFRAAFLDRA